LGEIDYRKDINYILNKLEHNRTKTQKNKIKKEKYIKEIEEQTIKKQKEIIKKLHTEKD
jgi:acetyl-CoA carboxylase alpha subunit